MDFPPARAEGAQIPPPQYCLLGFLDDRTVGGELAEGVALQEMIDEGDFDATHVHFAARRLQERGFVQRVGDGTNFLITALGAEVYQSALNCNADPPARLRYVRTAFIRAVYRAEHCESAVDANFIRQWHDLNVGDVADHGPTLGDLYKSGYLYAFGAYILGPEMLRISLYLEDRGYLTRWPGSAWPTTRVSLTSKGIDCVESGVFVHEFEERSKQPSAATYLTHITNSQGVIIGQQSSFTQHNSSGLDATKVASFAALVRQITPTLGLEKPSEASLDEDALRLHEEATGSAPDRGRIRKLLDAVLAGLTSAAPTVASQMAIGVGEDVIKALGHN